MLTFMLMLHLIVATPDGTQQEFNDRFLSAHELSAEECEYFRPILEVLIRQRIPDAILVETECVPATDV